MGCPGESVIRHPVFLVLALTVILALLPAAAMAATDVPAQYNTTVPRRFPVGPILFSAR